MKQKRIRQQGREIMAAAGGAEIAKKRRAGAEETTTTGRKKYTEDILKLIRPWRNVPYLL